MTTPLSVLDLAPTSTGRTRKDALDDSVRLAQTAEQAGFKRFWLAEHHGSATFMSSATALLIGRAAEHTSTIRVGSGGVMLPNHAPLMVAEYYGTLATLYPDRIDLGLGRAPGTDPVTAAELRRGKSELNDFAADVLKLQNFFSGSDEVSIDPGVSGAQASVLGTSVRPHQIRRAVRAIPGEGTNVPLWMLGSSTGGAQVAAELGLPFSFASHFAPTQISAALQVYRNGFKADAETAQVDKPTVMAGVNIMVAETEKEAQFQATTHKKLQSQLRFGSTGPLQAPTWEGAETWSNPGIDPTHIVGTPGSVAEKIGQFVEAFSLDEVIVTCYAFDPAVREKALVSLAQEWTV